MNLELGTKEFNIIKDALDFYIRIGLGQFERLKEHPMIELIPKEESEVDIRLIECRNVLFNLPDNKSIQYSLGIGNKSVTTEVKHAYNMYLILQKHEIKISDSEDKKYLLNRVLPINTEDIQLEVK